MKSRSIKSYTLIVFVVVVLGILLTGSLSASNTNAVSIRRQSFREFLTRAHFIKETHLHRRHKVVRPRKTPIVTATATPVPTTSVPIEPPVITSSYPVNIPTGSTNYYVSPSGSDSNDGSRAHPFATIQKAGDQATPGTVIHVLPGTYTAPLDTTSSGTPTAHITYVSSTKWSAKIRTTGVRTSWINEGDYVDIIGFDITGDGEIGTNNFGSFVRVMYNHVHNISVNSCNPSLGGAGIDNSDNGGNHDNDVIGNVVNDIGPSTTDCNLVQGIYHSTLRGHILNNIVYHIASFGIHTWHAPDAVTIANNLVFQAGRAGIIVAANQTVADHFIIVNNILIQNQTGIEEYGSVGTHNEYSNNLLFENGSATALENGTLQNTLFVAPQFVNYQPNGSGDYHLKAGSPCIGTGTSTGAPTIDIDGTPRPQGKGWDIGPYQYHS